MLSCFYTYNTYKSEKVRMSKKIVFTFGRFNPPTTGHFLLATKVKQEASRRGADHIIYGSSSHDPKKNPLNSRQKLRFMKKVLKGFNVEIDNKLKNPFDVLSQLNKEGYTDVVMVVGADRVSEFKRNISKNVGPNKLYKFDNFEVVSAGERDPDADDVSGMSASKMRAAAAEGNLNAFKLGVPSHVNTNDVKAFFKAVQTGMKIKPFIAESWFDYDEFEEFVNEEKVSNHFQGCDVVNDTLKKFDMSGVGLDTPTTDNKAWGPPGIKDGAKKKKKVKGIYEYGEVDETSLAQQAQAYGAREGRNAIIKKIAKEVPAGAQAQLDKNERRVIKRIRKLGADKVRRDDSGNIEQQSPHIWDFTRAHKEIGKKGELKKQGWEYSTEGKISDKIDAFKFHFKPEEVKKRKEESKRRKQEKKYNKMVGIPDSVEHEEGNELNELTIQARRKMARSAKRTAKKRQRKREMKKKRKKSDVEIKRKAQKTALSVVRKKMIKGMKWSELSFSQRESIEKKLKKKKKVIGRLAQRLVPKARIAEKERLQQVRAKMTTNDPAKAIESIDYDFEMEVLSESARMQKAEQMRIAKQKERDRGTGAETPKEKNTADKRGEREVTKSEVETQNPWEGVVIVRTDTDKIQLIPVGDYDPNKHTLIQGQAGKEKKGKVNKGSAAKISQDPDFKRTKTYTRLVGWEEEKTKEVQKAKEKESKKVSKETAKQQIKPGAEEPEMSPALSKASDKAGIAGAGAEEAEANVRTATANQQLAALQPPPEDGSVLAPEIIQAKMAKLAKQKPKHGATDPTDFAAVDVEAGVVAEFNRMIGHPDEIGNISDDNWQMLNDSATLVSWGAERYGVEESAATRVVRDSINPLIKELDPKGEMQWHMEHSGTGMDDLEPSKHWKSHDASDATPKSDAVLISTNEKGERTEYGISVKAGPSQLLSPTPEEANAILTGIFGKMMAHCEGVESEQCKSLLQGEKGTSGSVDALVKMILEADMRAKTGYGGGPLGWFKPGGKYRRAAGKPDWWDTYGPGSKCKNGYSKCETSWESLEGTPPKPEHWEGTPADFDAGIFKIIEKAEDTKDDLNDALGKILNESKAFTTGLVHEAMTGCIKFCGCCMADCNCTSAVPTYYLTMSPDGSNSAIREINEQLLVDVSKETKFDFSWKTGQTSKGNYAGYIALRSNKRPKSAKQYASLTDGVQPFLKYSNIFMKEDMDMKDAKMSFANDSRNQGDDAERIKEFKSVKGDPGRLLDALGMKVNKINTNDVPWQDVGIQKPSEKSTEIRIDGKKKRIPIMNFKEREKDMNEEFQSMTEKAPADSYEFKDSTIHGLGSFATKEINENEQVGLYYLNLLSENENAPQYQRTDFRRFTNHSQHIPNIKLVENADGNIYTHATRDIQEGEEILIDYFHVFDVILPALKESGEVIPEVLRWTDGYDGLEIPPDSHGDLRDELAYFTEINEAVEIIALNEDCRADYLKNYNAQPEQRKRRSARTNERNKRIRKGQLSVGDGKDVDHKDGNPLNNSPSNINITSVANNRSRNNNKWRTEEHGAGEMGTEKLLKRYIKDTPFMTVTKDKK